MTYAFARWKKRGISMVPMRYDHSIAGSDFQVILLNIEQAEQSSVKAYFFVLIFHVSVSWGV